MQKLKRLKLIPAFFLAVALVCLLAVPISWAGENKVEQTISSAPPAGGTWTSDFEPASFFRAGRNCNISISGTSWVATVTLQRSFDSGANWHDVDSWNSNDQPQFSDSESGMLYRIGVKNGEYTSGSVTVRLSK